MIPYYFVFLLAKEMSPVSQEAFAGCAVTACLLILHYSRNLSKYVILLVMYFDTGMIQTLEYYW